MKARLCRCVSSGTQGLALVIASNVHVIAPESASCGTRFRDLRDAVEPLGLKQEAEAEIAYLGAASAAQL